MDIIIQLFKDNFVFIALFIVVMLLINFVAKKLLPIIGLIFVLGLAYYAFTGDDAFLNKTVDSSTQAVNIIKSEVGSAEYNRISETTFELKTKGMTVSGDEATKIATVKAGEKTFEIPLSALYKLLSEDLLAQIKKDQA